MEVWIGGKGVKKKKKRQDEHGNWDEEEKLSA